MAFCEVFPYQILSYPLTGITSEKGISRDLMIGVVAGGLGLVVLVLTIAIVVLLIKKTQRIKTEVYFQIKQPSNVQ
jgi:hypothetical protein